MPTPPAQPQRGLAQLFNRRRVVATLGLSLLWGLLLSPSWSSNRAGLLLRTVEIGLVAMIAFGIAEQWPRRLPSWIARWVLQIIAVALSIVPTVVAIYVYTTAQGELPFWRDSQRASGVITLSVTGLLFIPWVAVTSLVRQRDSFMRNQALAFQLERSELERRAADARLRLLQAQVEPHFLFNTLANIRELVDSGSAQASAVLGSLIAYLRAAVPRLNDPATTLGQEIDLVRAYLELMQMRMPDRLHFDIETPDPDLLQRPFPPMAALTLVENAVRHGIDPLEQGGHIQLTVARQGSGWQLQVGDDGAGIDPRSQPGTGLANLRERLQGFFGPAASLVLEERQPQGLMARIIVPEETRP